MSETAGYTEIVDAAGYAAAVELAVTASAAYYGDGTSTVDDDTFDRLVRGIVVWEEAHPDEVLPGSPTGKVAGGAVVGDVPHTRPMLSLDNVFSAEELTGWAEGLERRLGRPVDGWAVEAKLDGLAISARYRDGALVQLVTRGDGTAGEDVSHGIGTIAGLPEALAEPVTVEIRGEVLLTREQFEAANLLRVEHGGTPFANPRSGAAGSLRAKDRAYQVELTFFGYGALPLEEGAELAADLAALPHTAIMEYVSGLGIQTSAAAVPGPIGYASLPEVTARIEEIAAARAGLPFGIDGIVVKADSAADQETAGLSSRAPRWAIAYKLPADTKITTLREVEWSVGRTGVIAPRAVLDPVEIDGTIVTYATLHNPADIARRGLMLGDRVTVYKAGDVIPRVEAPLVETRTGEELPIAIPETCPRCGGEIDRSQERWRCVLGRDCNAVASISYAVGRDQLDIEGLGHTRIVQLVDADLIGDFADLFSLTREQLLSLERMGEVSTDNLLAAIEAAKGRPLNKVFAALGVRGTGRSMSRRIARHFVTMDAIRAADAEKVQEVEGIGPERATIMIAELAELEPLIGKLTAAGVNLTEPGVTPREEAPDLPLTGMSVVVTGSMTGPLESLSRNEMNELIERAGGKASSSVSKNTALLVAGEKAGSKRAKAETLEIRVITPDEFATLVTDFLP
ncbi:NAD-dependent DNA ligase LigA [Actinocorallia longicatena]|uniref:DNA ligase n=1 Tax=Actinocorallia longicatena TaxID=111803 RepID=A0ABP6QJ27_9ACTN